MSSIDESRIKLFQLRALAAIAKHGSFGKAATELNLTQSAISHAIASLEDELGVVLLYRGRQGASLTPTGEELLIPIQKILEQLHTLINLTQKAKGLAGGQVRVAAIRSLATHWLPSAIASFKQRHPQISISITHCVNHGEVYRTLRSGTADVGLMDLYNLKGIQVYEMFCDNYIVLLPPQSQFTNPPNWSDLAQIPLILPVPHDNSYHLLREYLNHLPIHLKIAYEVNEDTAIVKMVAEGLGMTILPYLAAIPIPPSIHTYPLPQPLQRQLGAVILEDALHPPPVYAFLDLVQELTKTHQLPYELSH